MVNPYTSVRRSVGAWFGGIRQGVRNARLTLRLARSSWGMMATFIFLALLNAITDGFSVMLLVPLVQSFSTDTVFAGIPFLEWTGALLQPLEPVERLRWVAGLIFLIVVMKGVLQYLQDVMVYIMPLRLERDLRIKAFMAMMESKLSFAEGVSAGDIGNYTAAFPVRTGVAARFLMQLISSFLTIGLMMGLLLAITPTALIALLGFAVVTSILFRGLTGRLSKRLDLDLTNSQRDFTQAYFEAVNNKRTIRIFNATGTFLQRIRRQLESLRKVQSKTIAVQNATYPFFSTLSGLLVCAGVLAVSLYQPERSQALLGLLLVFVAAATRLLGPLSILHVANMHFSIHAEAVVQMNAFFIEAEKQRDHDGTVELKDPKPAIRFDRVRFTYPGSDAGLKDVSFEVKPGEFVALVGPSGAGKSTVFHLITRLYQADAGGVYVGDTDLRHVVGRTWWDRISIVSQDIPIFNSTVMENIHFGSSVEPDRDRLNEALRLAAADEFVAAMPDGIHSRLGEFGSRLSGGERQRLALARAFFHRRPIILLDEVTSQLDAQTEACIAASIKRLHEDGHTIVAIAHRFSTVREADRLIVLEKGRLIDEGAPDVVMERTPYVRSMVRQMAAK